MFITRITRVGVYCYLFLASLLNLRDGSSFFVLQIVRDLLGDEQFDSADLFFRRREIKQANYLDGDGFVTLYEAASCALRAGQISARLQ